MSLFQQEIAALQTATEQRAMFNQAREQAAFSKLVAAFPAIRRQVPLKPYCNFAVGGQAALFYEVTSESELMRLYRFLRTEQLNLPIVLLGQGCNLLLSDNGVNALVIYLGDRFAKTALSPDYHTWDYPYIEEIQRHHALQGKEHLSEEEWQSYALIHVQAGQTLKRTVQLAAQNSYSGLEFACGIPGTVGGTTYMNAGAYGGTVADCLLGVRYLSPDCNIIELRPGYLDLQYRSSYFMSPAMQGAVILGVTYLVQKANKQDIAAVIKDLTIKRESLQPLNYPSAGSIFKRPEGYYAGKLISDAKLKGFRIGGAMVSDLHAGFIVNVATDCQSRDICRLIHKIQKTVQSLYGVTLATEVRYIGDFTEQDFED